jgi:Fe-S cluster biogenesis protein NfuA/nitrite reductase/ring-hydroxylating ferredoxin subunit
MDRAEPPGASPGQLLDRVQSLSEGVDALEDARARELAQELVGAVIAMYGDGLERIIETISSSREAGASILDQLSQDGAVASLLLIHDLYPVSLHERVNEALDSVRPYMESHGGDVELRGIEDGVAKLALQGSCNGCAASQATLELAIKQALDEHAPDLVGLEVIGADPPAAPLEVSGPHPPNPPFVVVGPDPGPAVAQERPARWIAVEELGDLADGELRPLAVDGEQLLVANIDGSLLAYRDACAACGEPLHGGELTGPMLRCPQCLVEFDLPRAGRAGGGEPLQLAPVPLLRSGGLRVAV